MPEADIKANQRGENVEFFNQYVEFEDKPTVTEGSTDEQKMPEIECEKFSLKEGQYLYEQCKSNIKEDASIRVVDFKLYNQVPVTWSDNYRVKKNNAIEFSELLCMIINREEVVVAVGRLVKDESEYRVIIRNDKESISYDEFRGTAKYKMILFDKSADSGLLEYKKNSRVGNAMPVYAVNIKLRFLELEETDRPLCIDFGTSNTTAGTYGIHTKDADELVCVQFEYEQGNTISLSKFLPTMAYVKSCIDKNDIRFLFGYEAKKKVMEKKYDTDATVYFELKRWITELDRAEDIEDEDGNIFENINRAEIISQYLRYVITL